MLGKPRKKDQSGFWYDVGKGVKGLSSWVSENLINPIAEGYNSDEPESLSDFTPYKLTPEESLKEEEREERRFDAFATSRSSAPSYLLGKYRR